MSGQTVHPIKRLMQRRVALRAALSAGLLATPMARALAADAPAFTVSRPPVATLPHVALVTMNGQRTSLARELDVDTPVWLNFVFTTCSTTCSMQTAVLAALQARLLRESRRTRFISLTIDPDNDTPEQLTRFAARFGIRHDWNFCTGRFDDLLLPQQAFDVYRGSKAAHPPVVMLRTQRTSPWVRITGFPSADDLHAVLTAPQRRPA
jgi:protein SCO1